MLNNRHVGEIFTKIFDSPACENQNFECSKCHMTSSNRSRDWPAAQVLEVMLTRAVLIIYRSFTHAHKPALWH